MKKVIGIINDILVEFDESSVKTGCGGSETWTIEIAKEFVRQGYYVYVFSHNPIWHISECNVEYVPLYMFDYILSFQYIDYFLVSRHISKETVQMLENNKERVNHNIYPVAHDVLYTIGSYIGINDKHLNFNDEELKKEYGFFLDNISKIICMSNCGIQMLYDLCGIEKEKCIVIGNGLDLTLFENLANNKERDNNIFWSSRYERDLNVLTDKILPLLKKEFPDIKVRVAQYFDSDVANIYKDRDDVEFIGKLGKQELYKEMSKHKIWFYPNIYVETFCITVLEEALCGCEIILPYRHGPEDTLAPFKDLLLSANENFDINESIEKTAQLIIDKIKNYDNNQEQRKLIEQHIKENYSWKRIVEQFTELFNNKGES